MINLSGAIGVTSLKKKLKTKTDEIVEKKVIIFSDNHDNKKYCGNYSKSFNIKKLLEKNKYNSQVLLEEVKRDDHMVLKELWGHSEHTVNLKEFYLNNTDSITPIDIRPYLYTFSYDILKDNEKKEITLKVYLDKITKFFNFKDIIPSLKKKLNNVIFNSTGICKYFKVLKKIFNELTNDIDLNISIFEFEKINTDFFYKIDDISSKIMDWYTIINIFLSKKVTIIHAGLFHTSNIVELLSELYGFKKYYETGITNININDSNSKSCIKIDSKLI